MGMSCTLLYLLRAQYCFADFYFFHRISTLAQIFPSLFIRYYPSKFRKLRSSPEKEKRGYVQASESVSYIYSCIHSHTHTVSLVLCESCRHLRMKPLNSTPLLLFFRGLLSWSEVSICHSVRRGRIWELLSCSPAFTFFTPECVNFVSVLSWSRLGKMVVGKLERERNNITLLRDGARGKSYRFKA